MELKHILNSIIDIIFEDKRKKKTWKPLTNTDILDGLNGGKLFVACIKSSSTDFVSKAIRFFSGDFVHVVAVCDYDVGEYGYQNNIEVGNKLSNYYNIGWNYPKYLVLASADDNGMNYFDLSVYQNREMVIFDVTNDKSDDIIKEFLSPEIMNAHYDYTGLVGQIFRFWHWLYKKFDDDKSWYCSEQADIFLKRGIKIAGRKDPNPTDVYEYCKDKYKIVYSSLKGD